LLLPEDAAIVGFFTGIKNDEFFLLNSKPALLLLLVVRVVLPCLEEGF
jgi:hypothetical protein